MIEHGLSELELPSLTAQRRVLKDGTVRCVVLTCTTAWSAAKQRSVVTKTHAVGVIEKDREFGRVLFKEEFVRRFPQLLKVTVIRKADHRYVYIRKPMPSSDQRQMYHQPGRKNHPQLEQALALRSPKSQATPSLVSTQVLALRRRSAPKRALNWT